MNELEQLKDAIRRLSTNPELLKMVGPSDEENAAAGARMKQIDTLEPHCKWGLTYANGETRNARERYHRIMAEQSRFEERYC